MDYWQLILRHRTPRSDSDRANARSECWLTPIPLRTHDARGHDGGPPLLDRQHRVHAATADARGSQLYKSSPSELRRGRRSLIMRRLRRDHDSVHDRHCSVVRRRHRSTPRTVHTQVASAYGRRVFPTGGFERHEVGRRRCTGRFGHSTELVAGSGVARTLSVSFVLVRASRSMPSAGLLAFVHDMRYDHLAETIGRWWGSVIASRHRASESSRYRAVRGRTFPGRMPARSENESGSHVSVVPSLHAVWTLSARRLESNVQVRILAPTRSSHSLLPFLSCCRVGF